MIEPESIDDYEEAKQAEYESEYPVDDRHMIDSIYRSQLHTMDALDSYERTLASVRFVMRMVRAILIGALVGTLIRQIISLLFDL
jgi:hypothetical protein